MAFSRRYRYRFGDIDHAGIAYYPKLLHLVHCAFEDWWADALGKPYPKLLGDDRFGFPAVHIDIDFFRPIVYGDEPIVHVGVLALGNASVEFGFWARREDDPAHVFFRARKSTVGVDMDTMKPILLPDRWRAQFEAHRIDAADWPKGRER